MLRYFAYGSNLDHAQMRRRCPSSRAVCCAVLADHRLTFPRPCESWGGGVAGVEPAPGAEVHGVVYELCHDDLLALDRYEGVAEGDYTRCAIDARADTGEPIRAWIYLANPCPEPCPPPSRRYLDAIVRGARYHRLPEAYVEQLTRTPTVECGDAVTP